ncbi:DUF2194 domain-containing protein [bacterium]|nr:DUF2194 domain-containing protein [bacterium]
MARVANVKSKKTHFSWLILPFIILLGMAVFMASERAGVEYQVRYPPMQFLQQQNELGVEDIQYSHSNTLVLFDSDGYAGLEHFNTILDVLDSMRVTYDIHDINDTKSVYDLDNYEAAIVTFIEIDKAESEILDLVAWAENGGRLMFSIRPDPSSTFTAIYRKLGIISAGDDFVETSGVEFVSDLLPGASGLVFGLDFIVHSSYPYGLEEDAVVYALSGDEFQIPIIWEYDAGKGKIVVINTDQFNTKANRGILGASYSLLFDAFIYPVINASVYYIDDFPSPIPEGANELITEQFNRDIQSFFINVWWPDIHELSVKYGIRFTGVIIETYNDYTDPPFEKQPEIERHQYFGGLLLDDGGELGFHGYNHVSLCLEDAGKNEVLGYPNWPSDENMILSIYELYSFASNLFPEYEFNTYVPPSNVLCENSREWLPNVLPDLKVIASVYLEEEDGLAYEQEFEEADDGIIEFPRVIAGYNISSYAKWAAINELGLHYVNTHFVHPDDVLSEDRGASLGWNYLKDQFEAYVIWLEEAAPGIRNMTAKEGAMAVQRYYRLELNSEYTDGTYKIDIDNFYDEAWFMLKASGVPESITGGEITKISDNLYLIQAFEPNIVIYFSE